MADFVNVASLTYCGKEAQEIFSKSVYNLPLAGYGITLLDNVKGKQKIYSGETGDMWQKYTCPFTPSGSATLAESTIEPVRIKINQENCYDSWDNTYLVEQTRIALDGGIPQTFSDWYFNQQLLPKMEKEYQAIFWQGDTAYSGAHEYLKVTDGIEKKIKEADGANLIQAAGAITVDNVISQVEAVVMKALEVAAKEDVDTENYKIMMNYADLKLLEVALGKEANGNLTVSIFKNYSKNGDTINVMGFDVVPTMQSRGTILMGPVNNLVLGFDTFSHTEYRLIDMRETTGDNSFRVLALSNIAVGIVLPELFVYSHQA